MEQEGVIKFNLRHTPGPALPAGMLLTLNAWRTLLFRLRLIGQDRARYGGVGYGNVSQRLEGGGFAITGSQTAHLDRLDSGRYSVVTACDSADNSVVAEGPVRPSSESLTHDQVYRARPDARFVFHVHSPEIWRHAQNLGLPRTPPDVAYGTPAMADAVADLVCAAGPGAERVFVMGGHEDGVVSFGATAEDAGLPLLAALARALVIEAASRH